MRNNFLSFIESRKNNQINENFSEKNIKKAISLITSILKKNIKDNVLELPGFANVKVNKDSLLAKQFLAGNKVIHINWLKSSENYEPYSIDIFSNNEILTNNQAKSKVSIFTLGSSIVHFLPVIWTIVNTGNYNISEEEIKDLSKKIFKSGNVKESYGYVGALRYRIFENIDYETIRNSFKINEGIRPNEEVEKYRKNKRKELEDAYNKKNYSEEDNKRYKQLESEYDEIRKAIAGGATSLKELRMAIKQNITVINEIDGITKEIEDKFNSERENPEKIFKKMNGYVKMVIKGINPSVILCGAPGLGKTYRVKQQLKSFGYEEDKNLFTIKGKCTPRRLYLALYDFKKKGDIVLIDDADALVGPNAPEDCINILKAALDSTSDDEGRLVSYGVSGKLTDDDGNDVPKRFHFNGGIIVITNWNAGKLDTALRGRSYIQDINFSLEEILQIIKDLMPKIDPEHLSAQSKLKAYDYLVELKEHDAEMEVSIRTFNICAKIFEAVSEDEDYDEDDAKSMIKEQMKLQAQRITGRGGKY